MPRFDKCSCSIYFTDEHFNQILEQIQYIRQIAHTIPTFEAKEGIYDGDEFFDEYDYEEWDMNNGRVEEYMPEEFEETSLRERKEAVRIRKRGKGTFNRRTKNSRTKSNG